MQSDLQPCRLALPADLRKESRQSGVLVDPWVGNDLCNNRPGNLKLESEGMP